MLPPVKWGAWRSDAACIGMDIEVFFPQGMTRPREAEKVCGTCPVQAQCLDEAMTSYAISGYWGGTSHRARKSPSYRSSLKGARA